MRNQQPQSVIVYRSKGEQMRDEVLWSEGYFTPTIAGDICVSLLAVVVVVFCYSAIRDYFDRHTFSWFNKLGRSHKAIFIPIVVVGLMTIVSTSMWCYRHIHITIR